MTITREQVADLQPGDVVELTHYTWGEGKVVGPLFAEDDGVLRCGPLIVRHSSGYEPAMPMDLTVVSHAPRPLYVNHPRTEPVPGDVARDADDAATKRTWLYTGDRAWGTTRGHGGFTWTGSASRLHLPDRLRLLVDGETGQAVQ